MLTSWVGLLLIWFWCAFLVILRLWAGVDCLTCLFACLVWVDFVCGCFGCVCCVFDCCLLVNLVICWCCGWGFVVLWCCLLVSVCIGVPLLCCGLVLVMGCCGLLEWFVCGFAVVLSGWACLLMDVAECGVFCLLWCVGFWFLAFDL